MQMFMIHIKRDNKSIPLLWSLDMTSRSRLGHDVAMLYSFPNRDEAEQVMTEAMHEPTHCISSNIHRINRITPPATFPSRKSHTHNTGEKPWD